MLSTQHDVYQGTDLAINITKGYNKDFLCKKITKKQFFKLKTINMMCRKTILFLKLSSTCYAIGCKKYICRKGFMRISSGFMVGTSKTWKNFVCKNVSCLLQGDFINYGLDACKTAVSFHLNRNISLDKRRFKGALRNVWRSMVNTKQSTIHLSYRHCLNLIVLCVRSCMGTTFERGDDCL